MDKTPNSEHNSENDAADDVAAGSSTRTPPPRRSGTGMRTGRFERQLARRRQRERLIGVLIAVLGVAVLVVAFLALRNHHQAATAAGTDTHQSTPQPSPSVSSSSTSTSSSGAPSSGSPKVIGSKPLVVLNQTTTTGLAQQAAARFKHGGWRVTSAQDGYQNDVITTTAYYDPAVAGAKRAALALRRQFATIHRVAARFPQLPTGPVVVVLTTDYSA
jgi:cytoskeletal protein RodZ